MKLSLPSISIALGLLTQANGMDKYELKWDGIDVDSEDLLLTFKFLCNIDACKELKMTYYINDDSVNDKCQDTKTGTPIILLTDNLPENLASGEAYSWGNTLQFGNADIPWNSGKLNLCVRAEYETQGIYIDSLAAMTQNVEGTFEKSVTIGVTSTGSSFFQKIDREITTNISLESFQCDDSNKKIEIPSPKNLGQYFRICVEDPSDYQISAFTALTCKNQNGDVIDIAGSSSTGRSDNGMFFTQFVSTALLQGSSNIAGKNSFTCSGQTALEEVCEDLDYFSNTGCTTVISSQVTFLPTASSFREMYDECVTHPDLKDDTFIEVRFGDLGVGNGYYCNKCDQSGLLTPKSISSVFKKLCNDGRVLRGLQEAEVGKFNLEISTESYDEITSVGAAAGSRLGGLSWAALMMTMMTAIVAAF